MVRYDKCVEALYDRGLIEDKNKSLQMLKVMKGAISMSKSKTGECIFRTNRLEKKNLERLVKIDKRNSVYNIARVDTSKKSVVDRWMKMLDKKTTCSPQALLEELLCIREPNSKTTSVTSQSELSPRQIDGGEGNLQKLLDLRLTRDDTVHFLKRRRTERKPSEDGQTEDTENNDEGFVTERKEIRDKYSQDIPKNGDYQKQDRKIQGTTLSKSLPLHLPSLSGNSGFKRQQVAQPSEKTEQKDPPTLERDLTDWSDWRLKDKNWILGYVRREKTRHEDLILRNALAKIENEMSGANTIIRQQIRQKLQNEREEELRKVLRESQPSREEHTLPVLKRSKSVITVKDQKLNQPTTPLELPERQMLPKELKLQREKTVTFASNDTTKSFVASSPTARRENTVTIIYREPENGEAASAVDHAGIKKTSRKSDFRSVNQSKVNNLSEKVLTRQLSIISESPPISRQLSPRVQS